jgi:hypothetical protein
MKNCRNIPEEATLVLYETVKYHADNDEHNQQSKAGHI